MWSQSLYIQFLWLFLLSTSFHCVKCMLETNTLQMLLDMYMILSDTSTLILLYIFNFGFWILLDTLGTRMLCYSYPIIGLACSMLNLVFGLHVVACLMTWRCLKSFWWTVWLLSLGLTMINSMQVINLMMGRKWWYLMQKLSSYLLCYNRC